MRHYRLLWLASMLMAILVFPTCASKQEAKTNSFFETSKEIPETFEDRPPAVTSQRNEAEEQIQALEAQQEQEKTEPQRPLPTRKTDISMYKTNVVTALRALARAADLNIIISSRVKGEISLRLKATPWDDAFCGLLQTHGLTYIWEGDILRVITIEDLEHDLKMEAIKQKRKSYELGMKRVEPLMTKIIPIKFADAEGLKESLHELLTKDREGEPRGMVMVDEHTNSLIIQAIRDDIRKIISSVAELDRPTSQILIEAHIVEATRDTARELKMHWGGLYRSGDYWITPGINKNNIGNLGLPLSTPVYPATGSADNFSGNLSKGTRLGLGCLAQGAGRSPLTIQLTSLEQEGKVNILSSPSITTIDNQAAIIESGEEVPFQRRDADGNITIEWKKATLSLEVIPHVIDGRILKMKIVANKDEPDFTRTVSGNPTIITKKAATNLILFDGQTTVIGGLTKETTSAATGSHDIPLLDCFFKGSGKSNKMEDVLIFITPHILKEKDPARRASLQRQSDFSPAPNKSYQGPPLEGQEMI
ncbi:MAG: secretin N-terminal domain-containing protein [Thermodesulfobacteriota bacterium]